MTKLEIKVDIDLNWNGKPPTYKAKIGDIIYYDKETEQLFDHDQRPLMRMLPGVIDMIASPWVNRLGRLVIVEGARNVGKTFLTGLLDGSHWQYYKYPFAGYFKAMLENKSFDDSTEAREVFHFSTGFDITLLSMFGQGLLGNNPLIADRGFLSNIVLGIQQHRISEREGDLYLEYLASQGYLCYVTVMYLTAPTKGDDRNKDQWEFLDSDEMNRLYMRYMKLAKELEPSLRIVRFDNQFDDESAKKFKTMFGLTV